MSPKLNKKVTCVVTMMTESIRNDMVVGAKHSSVCGNQPSRGAAGVTTALIHVDKYSFQTRNRGSVR